MTSSLRTWPESLIVRVLLMVVSDYTVTTQTYESVQTAIIWTFGQNTAVKTEKA